MPAARSLGVLPEHGRLLERMLRLLSDGGVLSARADGGYTVATGERDALPDDALADPEAFADRMAKLHPHGVNELGLLRRSGGALAEVLRGEVDPLSILFASEGPGATEFYFTAPASRASNRLLGDAVAAAVANWPEGGRNAHPGGGRRHGVRDVVGAAGAASGQLRLHVHGHLWPASSPRPSRFMTRATPSSYRPLDIERGPGGGRGSARTPTTWSSPSTSCTPPAA